MEPLLLLLLLQLLLLLLLLELLYALPSMPLPLQRLLQLGHFPVQLLFLLLQWLRPLHHDHYAKSVLLHVLLLQLLLCVQKVVYEVQQQALDAHEVH